MAIKNHLRKYFIMGSQNCDSDPEAILHEALEAGITAFQFREKGKGSLAGEEKRALGKKLRRLCSQYDVPFFINDDIELVDVLDADGIHVGQTDTPIDIVRSRFPDRLVGLSVSNRSELEKSPLHLVDYIGAGPVYTTASKDDAKNAVGTEWIQFLRDKFPKLPIVGIGGIHIENASEVLQAGADGVAVISAITK